MPNQEPLDPRYVRFRDGFTNFILDRRATSGLRWTPWASNGGHDWRTFNLDKWDFIDFGAIGPTSPLESEYRFEPPPAGYWWVLQKGSAAAWLKDVTSKLWPEVDAAYERFKPSRPNAVWNPYDGSWREMRDRPKPPPVATEPGGPVAPGSAHDEFIRRANQLWADYQAGRITDEIYKIRLLELTREYT
jgi:hypothetical protein